MNSFNTDDPISASGAHFKSEYISASDDVELKVLQWQPKIKEPKEVVEPVIFVSGWVSHVSGWAELLEAMIQKRRVFYIETREKISARINKRKIRVHDFTIANIALDIINVCKSLPIELERSMVIGSSFGATALLEALKNNNLNVRCAFLVGPNSEFSAHPFMRALLYLPVFSYQCSDRPAEQIINFEFYITVPGQRVIDRGRRVEGIGVVLAKGKVNWFYLALRCHAGTK